MATVEDRYEGERGCGYRVPGGKYLIGGEVMEACPLLPIPLTVCPTCSVGIKFSRGWTWVDAAALLNLPDIHGDSRHDSRCILGGSRTVEEFTKVGLLWVGERSYSTEAFSREAAEMGVSRRIGYLPRGLKLGETVVLLAHKKVPGVPMHDVEHPRGLYDGPAIFSAFIPTHLEYVVKGDESDEELDNLAKQGYTLVRVHRKGEGA